jgi:CBS domain-containing protein
VRVGDVARRRAAAVRPGTDVRVAARLLVARGAPALVVVDDDDAVLGLVGEGDLLRAARAWVGGPQRGRLRRVPGRIDVAELMTTQVRTVTPGTDAAVAADLLLGLDLHCLPVLDGGRLTGLVTRRDLLRALNPSDRVLRAEVQRRIAQCTPAPGRWRVDVHDGQVLVRGPGDDPVEAALVTALLRGTGGATFVEVLVEAPAAAPGRSGRRTGTPS